MLISMILGLDHPKSWERKEDGMDTERQKADSKRQHKALGTADLGDSYADCLLLGSKLYSSDRLG
jgi:hypothetical protein